MFYIPEGELKQGTITSTQKKMDVTLHIIYRTMNCIVSTIACKHVYKILLFYFLIISILFTLLFLEIQYELKDLIWN